MHMRSASQCLAGCSLWILRSKLSWMEEHSERVSCILDPGSWATDIKVSGFSVLHQQTCWRLNGRYYSPVMIIHLSHNRKELSMPPSLLVPPLPPPFNPFPHNPHEAKCAHSFAPVMPAMMLLGAGQGSRIKEASRAVPCVGNSLTPQPASLTFSLHTRHSFIGSN